MQAAVLALLWEAVPPLEPDLFPDVPYDPYAPLEPGSGPIFELPKPDPTQPFAEFRPYLHLVETAGEAAYQTGEFAYTLFVPFYEEEFNLAADAAEALVSTVFNLFGKAWGLLLGTLADGFNDVTSPLFGLFGIATAEKLQTLAAYVLNSDNALWTALHAVRRGINAGVRFDNYLLHRTTFLADWMGEVVRGMNDNLAQIQHWVATGTNDAQTLFNYAQQQMLGLHNEALSAVRNVKTEITSTLPNLIGDTVTQLLPGLLTVALPAAISSAIGPLEGQVAQLAEQVQQEEACCQLGQQQWANETRPALDQLKRLKPLLDALDRLDTAALLAAAAALYAAGPDAVVSALEGLVVDPGEAAVHAIASWVR